MSTAINNDTGIDMNFYINTDEKSTREQLAQAYQILAKLGMDDLTYSHLSARLPNDSKYFIYPFGLLFSEVTAENLLTVNLEGKVLAGEEYQYNKTGYIIHSGIYQARPEINAVFHLHTPYAIAVSAMESGLLPISQFSFHFFNRLSYHDYDSLALDADRHGNRLARDLGKNNAMLLKNHGSLSCGKTIQEAFFYIYYLEQACKVQCLAVNSKQNLIFPEANICEQAAQDMRDFEPNLGWRDWQALTRQLKKC